MGIDDTTLATMGQADYGKRHLPRSPDSFNFVKTSGLRWRSSDATGRHSLGTPSGTPVFHRFGTSERHHQSHRHRHKKPHRLGTVDAASRDDVAAPSDCPGCR